MCVCVCVCVCVCACVCLCVCAHTHATVHVCACSCAQQLQRTFEACHASPPPAFLYGAWPSRVTVLTHTSELFARESAAILS